MVENNMQEDQLKKKIDERVKEIIPEILQSSAFTVRKLTDTPTDKNLVVPRGYVTRNSTTALRPTTSVLGEFYFDTSVNKPVWWNGTNYQDAAGNVV